MRDDAVSQLYQLYVPKLVLQPRIQDHLRELSWARRDAHVQLRRLKLLQLVEWQLLTR